MKILITGANGFIGKNLRLELKNRGYTDLYLYDIDSDVTLLDRYCQDSDFVFHLAGVNRPKETAEFKEGNVDFTALLLSTLEKHRNPCPIMMSSSVQAALDNPYGLSKREGEELVRKHSIEQQSECYIYRFPNVFGKWCRPNYNSAVATFCYNISRDLAIQVNDREVIMNLVYIDDVVAELLHCLKGEEHCKGDFCFVPEVYTRRLGEIVDLIYSFKATREERSVPDMGDDFIKKLYATYLSYLPADKFSYPLTMHKDERGSFTEIIRTPNSGQFSVNISKPGITKGNHWHHTKNEKFLVVSGKGVIRFRRMDTGQNDNNEAEIITYYVSGDKLEVVDIPVGYTHNIENLGDTDMVTFMWCNEPFNPEHPDTYFELV
mgnify:CR=1 FL=1